MAETEHHKKVVYVHPYKRQDGTAVPAKVWCGYGVFAHNSEKISALIADKKQQAGPTAPPVKRRRARAAGPPPRSQPPPALPIPA
jgi:hypothetical protein